jgi:hypothetical protein
VSGEQTPAAVVAFVRGLERRAWLFLWLQGGSTSAASQALGATIRAFSRQASAWPMGEWPGRFWRLLVATPAAASGGAWPPGLDALAHFPAGPRRALLLRLVAGLDEVPAAEVLGLDLNSYRQQLAEAVARDAQGQVDVAAWQALAGQVQQAARELPPRRLLEIAQLRETALWGPSPTAAASGHMQGQDGQGHPPRRRRWPWIAAVVLACVLALLATLDWGTGGLADPGQGDAQAQERALQDHDPVLVEELPAGPAPAIPPLPAPLPEPLDPLVHRADLLAWYLAGAPQSQIEREEGAGAPEPRAEPETPASIRERARAWQALGLAEQASLRQAAQAWDALEPAEQARLQARFADLDRMEQRGWRLGPTLGPDWPRLHLLLGYVGPGQRDALLQSLRGLGPAQRQDLAELGRRAGADGRPAMLAEWLQVPADQRAQWLRARSGD